MTTLTTKSQYDTIFLKKGIKIPAKIIEISEENIIYKNNGTTQKISINKVSRVILKNGESQTFTSQNEKTVKDSAKNNNEDLHRKIEQKGIKIGRDYISCAISPLINCSPSIDWSASGRDYFNPDLILIYVKVFYKTAISIENEWVTFKLKIDEKSGQESLKYTGTSDKSHEIAFLKCQRKVFKRVN